MTLLAGKRICVLTTGHLATSPRMTKAADAFAEAGARVHVVSTWSTPWAVDADRDIVRRRPNAWQWSVVDYRRQNRATYLVSGVRQQLALRLARIRGPEHISLRIAGFARERVFPEIVRKASSLDVDLVYGGGAGLAAAAYAGRKLHVPFGVDLEDFHTGDQVDTPYGRLVQELSGRIETGILSRAAFRTAGSEDISRAYRELYNLDVVTVNNTFPLSPVHARNDGIAPLRLYWFSQTIGPGRGLEDAIRALGMSRIDGELHLQGQAIRGYVDSLLTLARAAAPQVRIVEHAPCLPDDIVSRCAHYDIGLALETNGTLNRQLCLSNKALAYAAAGMAVVLTDTPGQRRFGSELGEGGFLYKPGDVEPLATQLSIWRDDRRALQRSMDATLAAATKRWNWDHADEKGQLIACAAAALASSQ